CSNATASNPAVPAPRPAPESTTSRCWSLRRAMSERGSEPGGSANGGMRRTPSRAAAANLSPATPAAPGGGRHALAPLEAPGRPVLETAVLDAAPAEPAQLLADHVVEEAVREHQHVAAFGRLDGDQGGGLAGPDLRFLACLLPLVVVEEPPPE